MTSERERMLAGELYFPYDPELVAARLRTRQRLQVYNATTPDETERRRQFLSELLGHLDGRIEIEPPFYCDYGWNITAGDNLYMNFNCVVLDCAAVTFGANVLIGPAVQIYAATHPTDPAVRHSGRELAFPVIIGDDVWIGGGAIICPGVSIGAGSTIAAGSVVTRDVPPRVIAAGNPCRVVRTASEAEK